MRSGTALMAGACMAVCFAGCGGGGGDAETRVGFADIPRLTAALQQFKADCGRYPNAAEGLNALLKQPSGGKIGAKWKGPYIEDEEHLKDPWDQPYQYTYSKKTGKEKVRVWSLGEDGKPNTTDDLPKRAADRKKRQKKRGRG